MVERLSQSSDRRVDFKGGNVADPATRGRQTELLPEVNRQTETADAIASRGRFGAFRV